jgi:uncharacterized protein YvpB
MITDYWHQNDSSLQTESAQDLLNINASQGSFNMVGMSPTEIHDELDQLGYSAEDHIGGTFEELREAVQQGPVLTTVKLGMKTVGESHAVVVIGISDSGDVRVNDPWTGESKTYSQDQFAKSWGSTLQQNSYMLIRPKGRF